MRQRGMTWEELYGLIDGDNPEPHKITLVCGPKNAGELLRLVMTLWRNRPELADTIEFDFVLGAEAGDRIYVFYRHPLPDAIKRPEGFPNR